MCLALITISAIKQSFIRVVWAVSAFLVGVLGTIATVLSFWSVGTYGTFGALLACTVQSAYAVYVNGREPTPAELEYQVVESGTSSAA